MNPQTKKCFLCPDEKVGESKQASWTVLWTILPKRERERERDEIEEEDQEIPIIKPSIRLKNLMDAERFYLYHGENELAKQAKSLMKKSKQFHDAAFKQQDIRTFFRS